MATAIETACVTRTENTLQDAARLQFERIELHANEFTITSFFKPSLKKTQSLHVYLEGDGLPWLTRTTVSSDPTSRDPLMLRLMALDPWPALYLGRPCYNGHAADLACNPMLWTHWRYSATVVSSMLSALVGFQTTHRFHHVQFFAHSGGGVLALLIADRLPETLSVTTIGGNLDTDKWTAYHGYSALTGSLNPDASKPSDYPELYYYGEEDTQTPYTVFESKIRQRNRSHLTVVVGFDHFCCWHNMWGIILSETQKAVAKNND